MERDVCLDSDAVIAWIKGDSRVVPVLDKLIKSRMHISSITAFELNLRETNLETIQEFINNVLVLPMDLAVAKKASTIHKYLKKSGKLIDVRDLFTAATAILNNCSLLTFNRKHFNRIKELNLFTDY